MSETKHKLAADWYFVHVLGALSVGTLATMFTVRVWLTMTSENVVEVPQLFACF